MLLVLSKYGDMTKSMSISREILFKHNGEWAKTPSQILPRSSSLLWFNLISSKWSIHVFFYVEGILIQWSSNHKV